MQLYFLIQPKAGSLLVPPSDGIVCMVKIAHYMPLERCTFQTTPIVQYSFSGRVYNFSDMWFPPKFDEVILMIWSNFFLLLSPSLESKYPKHVNEFSLSLYMYTLRALASGINLRLGAQEKNLIRSLIYTLGDTTYQTKIQQSLLLN